MPECRNVIILNFQGGARMKRILLFILMGILAGCGSAADFNGPAELSELEGRIHAAEAVVLSENDPASAQKNFGLSGLFDGLVLEDGLVGVSLHLPTSQGTIAANLWLSPECLLKRDRRLVALVPGTLANGAEYYEVSLPGREGFNTVRVLAKSGYCALTVDLPGTGESVHPEDGMNLRSADNAQAVVSVARPVATILGIRKWDVYSETGTGSTAALLLAQRRDLRSMVLASPCYTRYGPASAQAFDPAFRAFAAVTPYLPLDPGLLPLFFGAAYPDVVEAAVIGLLGPAPQAIPTGVAFNEIAEIPFTFDGVTGEFVLAEPIVAAAPAKADALFFQGTPDFVCSVGGASEMTAEYGVTGGGNASLLTVPGASHLMRFDAPFSDGADSEFWSPILVFLADH